MAKRLKPDERYALQDWESFRKQTLESTNIDVTESHGEKKIRISKLEADHEAWFAYYFPH